MKLSIPSFTIGKINTVLGRSDIQNVVIVTTNASIPRTSIDEEYRDSARLLANVDFSKSYIEYTDASRSYLDMNECLGLNINALELSLLYSEYYPPSLSGTTWPSGWSLKIVANDGTSFRIGKAGTAYNTGRVYNDSTGANQLSGTDDWGLFNILYEGAGEEYVPVDTQPVIVSNITPTDETVPFKTYVLNSSYVPTAANNWYAFPVTIPSSANLASFRLALKPYATIASHPHNGTEITVSIYDENGLPSDNITFYEPLASTDPLRLSTLDSYNRTRSRWEKFELPSPVELAAGTYWFVVRMFNYELLSTASAANAVDKTTDSSGNNVPFEFGFRTTASASNVIKVFRNGSLTTQTSAEGVYALFAAQPSNTAPTDITLSASSISESAAIGSTVGTLSATDAQGGAMSFSLVSGAGSTDNASFVIVGNELKTAVTLDYETKSSYSIRVRATDSGSLTYEEQMTITVLNSTADDPVALVSAQLPVLASGKTVTSIAVDPRVVPVTLGGQALSEGSVIRNTVSGQKFMKSAGGVNAFVAIELTPKAAWSWAASANAAWEILQGF
jgi:hypothetical protein